MGAQLAQQPVEAGRGWAPQAGALPTSRLRYLPQLLLPQSSPKGLELKLSDTRVGLLGGWGCSRPAEPALPREIYPCTRHRSTPLSRMRIERPTENRATFTSGHLCSKFRGKFRVWSHTPRNVREVSKYNPVRSFYSEYRSGHSGLPIPARQNYRRSLKTRCSTTKIR